MLVAVALAGCGGSSSTSSPGVSGSRSAAPASPVRLSVATVRGLGTVLVNGEGRTLYVFEPDRRRHVTCLAGCAAVWPPVMASSTQPTVTGPLEASLLGSDADPVGGRVVTYDGWPLYLYHEDSGPGTANGQAEDLNGGLWYVISPSGRVITTNPAA